MKQHKGRKVLLDHSSMRSGDTTTQSAFFTSEGEFSQVHMQKSKVRSELTE